MKEWKPRDSHSELVGKLGSAVKAVLMPPDHMAGMASAAQYVLLPLIRATDLEGGDEACRGILLEILTPQGNDDYQSHAAKLNEPARRQAALALFELFASLSAEAPARRVRRSA